MLFRQKPALYSKTSKSMAKASSPEFPLLQWASPAEQNRTHPYLQCPIVAPSPRWIRVKLGGQLLADSKRCLLLRQYGPEGLPTYYFPASDVRMDWLEPTTPAHGPADWQLQYWTLRADERKLEKGAWTVLSASGERAALQGYLSFAWNQMDAWYEEEEEIFVHARDPYKRVDVLESARHVRVVLDGETLAETRRPFLLFETSLPTRYYLRPQDVRLDRLIPSKLNTRCPVKGVAGYWSVQGKSRLAENIVWSYADPIAECPKIKNLLCFFNEKVDLYVDGELQVRPQTPWS